MIKYNKEVVHEYIKKLFVLCLEKGLDFEYNDTLQYVIVKNIGQSYICENMYMYNEYGKCPIWELLEKVKQLKL